MIHVRMWRFVPACVLALVPLNLLADHCPEDLLIPGQSEQMLAGLDISRHGPADAVALFGPAVIREEDTNKDYPAGSGWALFKWELGSAQLLMSVEFYTNEAGKKVEGLSAMRVRGTSDDARLRTGRGAGLGSRLAQLKHLYGGKYMRGTLRGSGPQADTLTFCFEDETALEFQFDPEGRVMQVFLAPSGE